MFGSYKQFRDFSAVCVSGQVAWGGEPRGTTGATNAFLDCKGYSQSAIRSFLSVMASAGGQAAYPQSDFSNLQNGTEILPELQPPVAGSVVAMGNALSAHINPISCKRASMACQVFNTSVTPASGTVYVLRCKRPCNTTTTSTTGTITGPADPVSVANWLFGLEQVNNVVVSAKPTVFDPHVSMLRAPGFHKYFDVVSRASFSRLPHGANKMLRLEIPGCYLDPIKDWATSVPVDVNSVQIGMIPGLDVFVVTELMVGAPTIDTTVLNTTSIIVGSVVGVLCTYRWREEWFVHQTKSRWASTNWTVGPAVAIQPFAVGIHQMNEFGTAQTNNLAPVI